MRRRVAAALLAVAATGCGAAPRHVLSTPLAVPTGLLSSHDPSSRCFTHVMFWAPKTLADDPSATYGDYQDLGLTAAEYAALTHTVEVTRRHLADATAPASWTREDRSYVIEQATSACRTVTSSRPSPSGSYGWPTG